MARCARAILDGEDELFAVCYAFNVWFLISSSRPDLLDACRAALSRLSPERLSLQCRCYTPSLLLLQATLRHSTLEGPWAADG